MLAQVYEDIIALKVGKKIYLEEQKELFNSIIETINNANEVLIEILKVRNNISLNINTGLILDHLAFTITKEAK
jgi:hypothetical protein